MLLGLVKVVMQNRDTQLFSLFLISWEFVVKLLMETLPHSSRDEHCVKSGVFSGPNTGKYGPEKTQYLNTSRNGSIMEVSVLMKRSTLKVNLTWKGNCQNIFSQHQK